MPGKYTNEAVGFQSIADQTVNAIGKRIAFARTQAQNEALSQEARDLVQGTQSRRKRSFWLLF